MTNHDESDTELTPTAQAPEVAEAWSLDDPDQPGNADTYAAPTRRHGLIVSLGLVALVVGIVGSVILLAGALFGWHRSKQAEPLAVPTTTTVPVAAPPPPTVTSTPGPSVYDQNFLSLMSQEGWGCTDNSDAEQCKKEIPSGCATG